jgi:hypothetical protein
MKSLRSLALAGTIAIAAALSSGANAAPAQALEIGMPTVTTESVATQAYFPGGYYQKRYLCYVPFFKLVRWYGFWQARMIKSRCFRPYYPNYYGGY